MIDVVFGVDDGNTERPGNSDMKLEKALVIDDHAPEAESATERCLTVQPPLS